MTDIGSKFSSETARLLHEAWHDDETGNVQTALGLHFLVLEEEIVEDSKTVTYHAIVHEDAQGNVDFDAFDSAEAAQLAFDKIESEIVSARVAAGAEWAGTDGADAQPASVAHVSYDYNQALESLTGREYVHRGIHGVLHYGGRRFYERLVHDPSAIGKETEAYAVTRRELGDDWSTDLTDSEEALVAIFDHFGIRFDAETGTWREVPKKHDDP